MNPRVIVFGTSFGCLTHVRGLRAAGFDVAAVVGRDPDRTAERAARFDVPLALTSTEAALGLPDIDAVSIATPPNTHHELVLAAIAAGKHVLCEKPFAADTAEAVEMANAADEAGIVHLLGTEFRFATPQALLRRVVASGAIGTPRAATFVLDCPMLADPNSEVPPWWADEAQNGGWLGAYGSHVVDQIHSTLGKITEVSADLTRPANRDMTSDDGYTVHFRLASGATGVMQSSAAAWDIAATTRIVGTEGTARIDGETVVVADHDGERQIPVPDDLVLCAPEAPTAEGLTTAYELVHTTGMEFPPFVRLAEELRDRIAGNAGSSDPEPATFHDGVAGMAVLDAIRRSAATGTTQPVA